MPVVESLNRGHRMRGEWSGAERQSTVERTSTGRRKRAPVSRPTYQCMNDAICCYLALVSEHEEE